MKEEQSLVNYVWKFIRKGNLWEKNAKHFRIYILYWKSRENLPEGIMFDLNLAGKSIYIIIKINI